jgi:uncharacterized protein YdiU (UPF0061 family)
MSANKLGFPRFDTEAQGSLQADLPVLLRRVETDMTLFYRHLADLPIATESPSDAELLAPLQVAFYSPDKVVGEARTEWLGWLRRYHSETRAAGCPEAERRARMNAVNPRYVLRNYLAQVAISAAEKGELDELHALQGVMRRPYEDQPGMERFAEKRPEWARNSPGCSMLSCSS